MIYGIFRLKHGSSMLQYLPLRTLSVRQLFVWLTAGILVMMGSGLVFRAMGLEESQEMNSLLGGVTSTPLMYIALVLAAPLFEELLVRGFMLSGFERIKHSEAASLSVFATAFLWTVIHAQYNAHEMFQVFLLGIVLGLI
jgi:membrane protease YdiL (CAAX protease family)